MRIEQKKGIVLVLILSIIAVLVAASASIMMLTGNEINLVRRQVSSTKAFYLAESGIELARTQLNADWNDRASLSGSLNDGTYSADIYDTDSSGNPLPVDELRVLSSGSVSSAARTVEVILKTVDPPDASTVTAAVATEGVISLAGSASITGDVQESVDLSFEDVFGVDKTRMKEIARAYFPETYYESAFTNSDTASEITWVDPTADQSQITQNGWSGSGIFIVRGNLKITGGTFNGVLWVEGSLTISGNPDINGSIFVESGLTVDTTITGTADITYNSDAIEDAFDELDSIPPTIESWREVV